MNGRVFTIEINGQKFAVEFTQVQDGVAHVEVNGTPYDVVYEEERKASKTPTLVRTPAYTTSVDRLKTTAKPGEAKIKGIRTPLPGIILEVKARIGDEVRAGEVIMVMEAMKMENNIVAPNDGKIKDIKVQKGDNVLEGDLLVEMEA